MWFPRNEERVYIKHALSQGKGSNIAGQHRGTSVGKGDFELPAAISSQNYEKKKKINQKTLDTPYAILQGERMSKVSNILTITPTHFSTIMQ